jgi:hypothetical protein
VGSASVFVEGDENVDVSSAQPEDPEAYPWFNEDYVAPIVLPKERKVDNTSAVCRFINGPFDEASSNTAGSVRLNAKTPRYLWDEGAAIQLFLPANNS